MTGVSSSQGLRNLGNMLQFTFGFSEYSRGARSPQVARRFTPSLQTCVQWLPEARDRIPVE